MQFAQIFTRSINWDEFGHYNHIIQLQAGELTQVLQRFHAFAYSFVTSLPGSPIDHIIVIRIAMFACGMIALAAVIGIASQFSARLPALLCGLAYLSFGYVFEHGASFRYDPPLAAALMALLWLLLSSKFDTKAILAAGFLVALLPLISIKAVLYAPAFAGIAYMRWARDGFARGFPIKLLTIGAAGLIFFVGLFGFMSFWVSSQAAATETQQLQGAAGAVFRLFDNPNWTRIIRAAMTNPLVALTLLAFPIVLLKLDRPLPEKIALAGLFMPLATPLIYVNTAPYYFTFMLAPVLAACGPVMAAALTRFSAHLLTIALCATTLVNVISEPPSTLNNQRALHAAIITTFGEDVRYFDFPGFLGTSGKANVFLSPLVISINQREGTLLLRPAMEKQAVPLVIANNFVLESALETASMDYLHSDDLAALRGNYIRFWGPLWIAGRQVPADMKITYDNLVPGTFTAVGGDILIDGRRVANGETIQLGRQAVQLEALAGPARLVWGDKIAPPASAPPKLPFWVPF